MTDIIPQDGPPVRKSRWVRGSGVLRYEAKVLDTLRELFHEADGWRNGARVVKRGR